MRYNRTFTELESKAVKWWPNELEATVAEASSLPKLIETQEKFISILILSGERPEQVFEVLAASAMPANLFLKHLVILADYGGELIKRLGREFNTIFLPESRGSRPVMHFMFRGEEQVYTFSTLPVKGLGNPKLEIDGKKLIKPLTLSPLCRDMIMILMYAATSDKAHLAALEKCEIGILLGDEAALTKYVRERYLNVSRITTGANTNSLGQIAQTYVFNILRDLLPEEFHILRNGSITLRGYKKENGMPFDIVVEREGKKIGIEVSFQVTTNSVIERKSGQAAARQNLMHRNGHFIAYVMDGAGNFQRSSAVGTICRHSDSTVAYSKTELGVLAQFILEKLHG
jgi:hypothetical protein